MSDLAKNFTENTGKPAASGLAVDSILQTLHSTAGSVMKELRSELREIYGLADPWETIAGVPDSDKAMHLDKTSRYAANVCAHNFLSLALLYRLLALDLGDDMTVLQMTGASSAKFTPEQKDIYEQVQALRRKAREADWDNYIGDFSPGQILAAAESFIKTANDRFDDYFPDNFFCGGFQHFLDEYVGQEGKHELFRTALREMTGEILKTIAKLRRDYAENELAEVAQKILETLRPAAGEEKMTLPVRKMNHV